MSPAALPFTPLGPWCESGLQNHPFREIFPEPPPCFTPIPHWKESTSNFMGRAAGWDPVLSPFPLTSPTAWHRWWKRCPSWRKSRAALSLEKHIHEFMQGKWSMRTGRSPFSSPAQSPGVIPACCMMFVCLQPTTLTSRQDVGRLRQEKVLDK